MSWQVHVTFKQSCLGLKKTCSMRNISLKRTASLPVKKKSSCPKRKIFQPIYFQGLAGSFRKYTLPETNSSHLKMDGWKTTFLLGPGLFSGAMLVSGRISKNIYSHTGFPGQVSFFSTAWMSQPLLFVNLTLHLKNPQKPAIIQLV